MPQCLQWSVSYTIGTVYSCLQQHRLDCFTLIRSHVVTHLIIWLQYNISTHIANPIDNYMYLYVGSHNQYIPTCQCLLTVDSCTKYFWKFIVNQSIYEVVSSHINHNTMSQAHQKICSFSYINIKLHNTCQPTSLPHAPPPHFIKSNPVYV